MSQLDSLLDLSLFGKNMLFTFDDKCTVGIFVLEKYLNFKYLSEVLNRTRPAEYLRHFSS